MVNSNSKHSAEKQLDSFREAFHHLNYHFRQQTSSLAWSTPNTVVLEHDPICVRRFYLCKNGAPAQSNNANSTLIVYSQVNTPYVIDLHTEHSLVRRLLEAGQQVYLLDWGAVIDDHSRVPLSQYIDEYIDIAVDYVRNTSGSSKTNLLGICQGGTFSLCYAALHPEKIDRLVTMVTPVDFHAGGGLLTHWSKYLDTQLLENSGVNVPGSVMTALFQTLRPFSDLRRQVEIIDNGNDPSNMELMTLMDQWVYGGPDQPATALAEFIRWFYQENRLISDKLEIAGKRVSLSSITASVLNIYAKQDHIVPTQSSMALAEAIHKERYEELVFPGGHIGLLISKNAQQTTLPEIGKWLATRPAD